MPAANRVNSDSFSSRRAAEVVEKENGAAGTRGSHLHADQSKRTRLAYTRGRARVHINSAAAEESPRSHVNHPDKMAPPCSPAATRTQRRGGNARSMFEKRKRGSSRDPAGKAEERRDERREREWRCVERYTRE